MNECRYSYRQFLTSALDGGEWSTSHPGRSGRGSEDKNSQSLPGLEPPFIQPVLYKYEGWLVLLGKLVDID